MKKMKKEDARIIKTRRDLRAALSDLMEHVNFDKITVSDICSAAMINRMTFYKHYNDKYDLLNDLLLEIKNNIIRRMETRYPAVKDGNDALDVTFCLIEAVLDECLQRRALAESLQNNELVLTMVSTTIEKSITALLKKLDKTHPLRYPTEMVSVAMTGAASFLVRHWLERQPEKNKQSVLNDLKNFFRDLFHSKILFAE